MKIRVLIADDAPFIHEVLKAYLGGLETDIVGHARDGEEMVSKALEFKPDLILADLAMPKKNGLTATAEILKALPDTSVIAMSSMPSEAVITEAIAAGCIDFIDKSFSEDILREAIENVRSRLYQSTNKGVSNG